MGRHVSGDEERDLVRDPDQPRWRTWAWWSVQPMRFFGPLTGVAMTPWALWPGLAVAGGSALAASAAERRLRRVGPHVAAVPAGGREQVEWQQLEAACRAIANVWPALGDLAEPRDIRPALDRVRFQVAKLIAARSDLQPPIQGLVDAAHGLAADDPLRGELIEQRERLGANERAVTAEIAERVQALQRLAGRVREFTYQQAVTDRARRAIQRATDVVAHAEDLSGTDHLEALTARTGAVLDAYHDLIDRFPGHA